MKTVQALLPVFGLIAAASASSMWPNTTTTEVVTAYTTVCPAATTFTQGTKTYTATAGETITVTNCPCTIKKTTSVPTTMKPVGTAPPVLVTTVVTAYTTYCPAPTTVVQGNMTYTVTSATTLTIKNCPCTISYPATTYTSKTVTVYTTYCPAPTTVTVGPVTTYCPTPGTYTIPVVTVTPVPASPPTPAAVVTAPSMTPTPSAPVVITNDANKVGAGLAGLVGLAAMLL